MKITKHGHACVRLDADGAGVGAVVIDPGSFSDVAAALRGAKYVLVTHDHGDHLDVGRLRAAMAADRGLQVFGNAPVMAALTADGAPAAQMWLSQPGSQSAVNQASGEAAPAPWTGWQVAVGGGWHAPVWSGLPRARNLTYLIRADGGSVYHPGDSFDLPNIDDGALDLLCVPVSGPWLKLAEAIDFVRGAQPRVAVPIHDALNSDAGNALVAMRLCDPALVGDTEFRAWHDGDTIEVS